MNYIDIYKALEVFKDEMFDLETLRMMEARFLFPNGLWYVKSMEFFKAEKPSLHFEDGVLLVEAENAPQALALICCLTRAIGRFGFMQIDMDDETPTSLSNIFGLVSEANQPELSLEQNEARWNGFVSLFAHVSPVTEADTFHLHCVNSRGFIFQSRPEIQNEERHIPQPGEAIKLFRYEIHDRSHGWMTHRMMGLKSTHQICERWHAEQFQGRHWFLDEWLKDEGINPHAFYEELKEEFPSLNMLIKEVVVPDFDEHFCDGEQYVERIPK